MLPKLTFQGIEKSVDISSFALQFHSKQAIAIHKDHWIHRSGENLRMPGPASLYSYKSKDSNNWYVANDLSQLLLFLEKQLEVPPIEEANPVKTP